VHGIDLVNTQLRLYQGEELAWSQDDVKLERHGVQLRILPIDPSDMTAGPDGTIRRLVLPTGDSVLAEAGTAEGQACTSDTDPLLVKLTVTGPTRHAALVRARAALEELVVEGVPTNQEFLVRLLADEAVWRGEYDVHTVSRTLGVGESAPEP
jgi:acetyl/propionyl-CoA carboxylase alpha subunit